MPAKAIVSELMKLLQSAICDAKGDDLPNMEQRAVDFGRRASELALGEMLASQEDDPVAMKCELWRMRLRRSRVQVTLAGSHIVWRARYQCRSCGAWIYPRDTRLGIGSGGYSAGVAALSSEVAAGFPFEASDMLAGKLVIEPDLSHSMFTISADGVTWTEMKCASFISNVHGRSTIATMSRTEKLSEGTCIISQRMPPECYMHHSEIAATT